MHKIYLRLEDDGSVCLPELDIQNAGAWCRQHKKRLTIKLQDDQKASEFRLRDKSRYKVAR